MDYGQMQTIDMARKRRELPREAQHEYLVRSRWQLGSRDRWSMRRMVQELLNAGDNDRQTLPALQRLGAPSPTTRMPQ